MDGIMLVSLVVVWLLVLVWSTGGRLKNIAHMEWHGGAAMLVVGALSVVLPLLPRGVAGYAFVLMVVGMVPVLLRNRSSSRGVQLLVIGALFNALVVVLFGAMPVSSAALATLGADHTLPLDGKHLVTSRADMSVVLVDAVPVPSFHTVVSLGDVLLLLGTAVVLIEGARSEEPA